MCYITVTSVWGDRIPQLESDELKQRKEGSDSKWLVQVGPQEDNRLTETT